MLYVGRRSGRDTGHMSDVAGLIDNDLFKAEVHRHAFVLGDGLPLLFAHEGLEHPMQRGPHICGTDMSLLERKV